MYGIVNIGGRDIELTATASTPIRMKQIFNIDLMKIFANAEATNGEEISSVMSQLAYLMNCQALKMDMTKINENTFFEWCEDFGPMDILEKSEEILNIYLGNAFTTSKAKKNSI